VAGIGYACAALVTPPATRRLSKPAWITLLLAASAVVTLGLGETFVQLAYLGIGFCMYLFRQGVAISATTILQEEVEDAYLGRVFAFYDMMYNAAYVAGAAASAGFMPSSGHSPLIVALVAAGYLLVAAAYWVATRRGQSSPGSGDSDGSGSSGASGASGSGTGMPTSAAQPSNS